MTPPSASDIHYYEPATGHGLPHDPLNAIIGPRPIGWISSQDADGRRNLAPYSFFNAFNYRPPIIGFSSIGAGGPGSYAEIEPGIMFEMRRPGGGSSRS